MPWLLDSRSRSEDIAAAVHELIATGGVRAVTYRAIAEIVRRSASTIHDHYPDRGHLLKICAHLTDRRRESEEWELARAGIEGLVPRTVDELRDTQVWLAYRDLARTEPMIVPVVEQARLRELELIRRCLERRGGPSTHLADREAGTSLDVAEVVQLALEGIRSARTLGEPQATLPHQRACELLTWLADALLAHPRHTTDDPAIGDPAIGDPATDDPADAA